MPNRQDAKLYKDYISSLGLIVWGDKEKYSSEGCYYYGEYIRKSKKELVLFFPSIICNKYF